MLLSTMVDKKVEIEGWDPLAISARHFCEFGRLDCAKRLEGDPIVDKEWCGFGSLGVPGPASTPLGRQARGCHLTSQQQQWGTYLIDLKQIFN